jgi:hypothetical protein
MSFFSPLTRRDWLRRAAIGVGAGSMSNWLSALAADVAVNPNRNKSVILLWLNGGPATIDLWDLKPGNENGGPFQEIATATPGIRCSQHLPKLATWSNELAVVRSMVSKEGDHGRASHFVRTGYLPQGALQYPAIGSLVAHEIAREQVDLPSFVSIAPLRNARTLGGGFLGPKFSPLLVGEQNAGPEDLTVPDLQPPRENSSAVQANRLALLEGLERQFVVPRENGVVVSMRAASAQAVRLMRPEAAAAFHFTDEPEKLRDAYGRTVFGQGCLLARRLVERGVAFVEVTLGGWDTHQNNFDRVQDLAGNLDQAFAALLGDLKERGLLASTLVVCQGEFGRTPKINKNNGRDHWPNSWATVLAGGGIKGGQVIGKTSPDGMAVVERPATVPDMIATVCTALGIDPKKQNISNLSRPIRIADPSAQPIQELL